MLFFFFSDTHYVPLAFVLVSLCPLFALICPHLYKKPNKQKEQLSLLSLSEFRNRVAVQLQKNLDRIRLKRVAFRLAEKQAEMAAAAAAAQAERKPSITTSSRTGGFFGPLPGQLPFRQKTPETEEDEEEESSYEYEDEEEEEEER